MLREHVETLLGDMLSARQLGGVLASGSRLGLLALKRTEAAAIAPNEVEQWEALRTVRLPWVDHLSASEILRLREEAAAALPRLRSLVAQKLAAPGNNEQQLKQLLAELRDQAIEVKAELDNLKWYRERGFRTLSGTLGISVAVYGLAAGFVTPAVALGSLLSMLGIVHSAERQDERDHAKIISKPGYVLMKARELAHHHG
jgi:hypothetical protein